MSKFKSISVTLRLSTTLLLAACGGEETSSNETKSMSEQLDYTITGIEPGAGIMQLTELTLEEYENLDGWKVSESSTAGMLTMLDKAYKNEEPIIVTGWNPHWKFASYDLKYLEDPKGTYGEIENINTITRKGLKEDMPIAYEILDRFYWDPEDMETVMFDAQAVSFEEAAAKWVEDNQDKVAQWTEGLEKVNGQSIDLISTP